MKFIIKYFFQGLLYITPLAVTIYTLFWVFNKLDNLFEFQYPGIGILILLITITIVGVIGSLLIQLPIFKYFDSQLERAPLVKIIYTSMKDLVKAFVGKKKSFNQPVMVKLYENSQIRRLGFITDEANEILGKEMEP